MTVREHIDLAVATSNLRLAATMSRIMVLHLPAEFEAEQLAAARRRHAEFVAAVERLAVAS